MHRLKVEKTEFHEHMASAGYEGSKSCVALGATVLFGVCEALHFVASLEFGLDLVSSLQELWKAPLAELADDQYASTYGPAGTRVEVKECRDGMMQVTILHSDKDASIPQHHLKAPGTRFLSVALEFANEPGVHLGRLNCPNHGKMHRTLLALYELHKKEINQKELQDKLIGNLDLQERGEDGELMKTMDRRSLGFARLEIRGQPVLFCTTHLMKQFFIPVFPADPVADEGLTLEKGEKRGEGDELCTINSLMSSSALHRWLLVGQHSCSDLVNPHEAVIFCGDFNINSRMQAHDFIWKKKFLKGEKDVKKDRFVKEIDANGDALIKFECNTDDPARLAPRPAQDHTGYEKDREELERRFVWERSDGRELKMRDAYDDVYGSNDASSTITGMREETIDYVFFDEEMLCLKRKSALKCPGVMPNDQEPSDHIPLVVTFDLPDVEVQLKEGLRRLEHHLFNLLKEGKAGEKLAIDVLLPLMQEAVEAARKQSLRTWLLTGSGDRPEALFRQPSIVVGKDFEVPKSFDWQFLGMKCSLYAASFRVRVEGGELPDTYGWNGFKPTGLQGCDAEYHGLYNLDRQIWQDAQIDDLLDRVKEEKSPWLLYTCGPMGVGKLLARRSFTLQWLNKEGYLNMQENMVKIDPDEIKGRSAYMMEIAQAAAMQKNFNVWVDGSLKDAEWYAQQFERGQGAVPKTVQRRSKGADEQTILHRVKERADGPDGRHVPPELVRASMASMVLQAVDSIDHSGIWEGLRARMDTTQSMRSSVDFPQSLRPLSLTGVSSESLEQLGRPGSDMFFRFDADKRNMLFDWKRSTFYRYLCGWPERTGISGPGGHHTDCSRWASTSNNADDEENTENHDGIKEAMHVWAMRLREANEEAFTAGPTTQQALQDGYCVFDGGATRTLGFVKALEMVFKCKLERYGDDRVHKVGLEEQCLSTVHLSVNADGKNGKIVSNALDEGEGPVLFSFYAFRKLTGHQLLDVTANLFVNVGERRSQFLGHCCKKDLVKTFCEERLQITLDGNETIPVLEKKGFTMCRQWPDHEETTKMLPMATSATMRKPVPKSKAKRASWNGQQRADEDLMILIDTMMAMKEGIPRRRKKENTETVTTEPSFAMEQMMGHRVSKTCAQDKTVPAHSCCGTGPGGRVLEHRAEIVFQVLMIMGAEKRANIERENITDDNSGNLTGMRALLQGEDDSATRKALGIDGYAQECCWIYPLKLGSNPGPELVETFGHLKQDQNPVAFVLQNGGFCYLNEESKIVALIAIVPVGRAKMQFKRADDIGYWHEVTLEFLKVGGEYGSFAYKFKQKDKQEVVVFDFIGAGTL
ncbi:hypothetical protein AK812_SmicGene39169 [Symbiodinium microadriaticum]|uniref:Uncharacterized protein n=1 Tax=Symbiodinium microadriaticum TaxID=2951 RepID=A0A1Q9CBW3_SYMMI|nr:hypothetical protein AK812_SmicGene39169 [Symbiodinium microadriaticum]